MIELVWDTDRLGTATAPSGATMMVGEHAHFSPDDLLAIAAASCLMRTFLRLTDEGAAHILSYAATAHAAPACASDAAPHVMIRAYLVAPPGTDTREVLDRFHRSTQVSPITRLLGDRVTATAEVRVLCASDGAD